MKEIVIKSRYTDYTVHIGKGIIDRLDNWLDPKRQYVLILDSGIPEFYKIRIQRQLKNVLTIVFPQGETHKSLEEFQRIVEILVKNNIDRSATIIALGGGVTGDLAGFVASTYLRGIPFIQIPTTLLAQIDSGIGGKVAVNIRNTKNVIGTVYPPETVIVDPEVLSTIDRRQFASGMAELIKYGMIADETLFENIRDMSPQDDIEPFIVKAIEIKKQFVEADELDSGIRQALNYGHTIGHAIEAYYNFEKYLHGEAVAIGMVRILKDAHLRQTLISVLEKHGLPVKDPVKTSDLLPLIQKDKKTRNKTIHYIDVPKIGTFAIKNFSDWIETMKE